jgi:hypothetical protein
MNLGLWAGGYMESSFEDRRLGAYDPIFGFLKPEMHLAFTVS